MLVKIDKFIKTGRTHFLCEDYILSGPNHIILSDGCSSVDDSDIGARLLCLAAARYLNSWRNHLDQINYNKMGMQIIFNADVMARAIGVNPSCLMATLIISFYHNDNIHVFVYGDGCVMTVDNHQAISYYELSFTNSCPFYLSYYLNPDIHKQYMNEGIVKTLRDSSAAIELEPDHPTVYTFSVEKYRTVAVASDGINSFNTPTDLMDTVKNCVIYKNPVGLFLQRQMIRFLSNLEKQMVFHRDDISIGSYYVEDQ